MQIPLDVGGRVKLILWVKERKLFATGKVTSRRPGFGNGVQFTEMSALDSQKLTEFCKLSPRPAGSFLFPPQSPDTAILAGDSSAGVRSPCHFVPPRLAK